MILRLRIGCEPLFRKRMPRPRLPQSEAAARISAHFGYELLSAYKCRHDPALVRCPKHGHQQMSRPANLFKGGMMSCCASEAASSRMKGKFVGENNHFYGKTHSIESRQKISKALQAAPHSFRGKARPQYLTDALKKAISGVARPDSVKLKLQEHMLARHRSFDFCVRKAACGKTAGKKGIFYIVRIENKIKFGSATTTIAYRLTRIRQKHGDDVELLMCCFVDDAGAYEAEMMRKYRSFWMAGEYFNDFRASQEMAS